MFFNLNVRFSVTLKNTHEEPITSKIKKKKQTKRMQEFKQIHELSVKFTTHKSISNNRAAGHTFSSLNNMTLTVC